MSKDPRHPLRLWDEQGTLMVVDAQGKVLLEAEDAADRPLMEHIVMVINEHPDHLPPYQSQEETAEVGEA